MYNIHRHLNRSILVVMGLKSHLSPVGLVKIAYAYEMRLGNRVRIESSRAV